MPSYYAPRYRYRPRRYRSFGRISSGRMSGKELAVVVAIGASLAVASGRAVTVHHHAHPVVADAAVSTGPSRAAEQAITFAKHQLGCPYTWGGLGPCSSGFDCSGLIYEAYRSAGVTIPRTTFAEWSGLRHVSRAELEPGDLILFAGSDGTLASPGHVVMYLGGGQVIQAYATGYPVRINSLASMGTGDLTGYARP